MGNNGWIKLHRKIEDSVVFSNEKGLKIWIWCLLRAGHKEKSIFIGRNKITLFPGQFVSGSNTMEEELNLGRSTVWYWLSILEKEGQVRIKTTNKYSIITIPNWDKYQEVGNKWEADGKQMGTNKNDKNDKKYFSAEAQEEIITLDDSSSSRTYVNSAGLLDEATGAWAQVNPEEHKNWLRLNKTERGYIDKLIVEEGYERYGQLVSALEKTNQMPYVKAILKPSELYRNRARLRVDVQKQMNVGKINKPKGRGFS